MSDLRAANPGAARDALSDIAPFAQQGRWVALTNRYTGPGFERLEDDLPRKAQSAKPAQAATPGKPATPARRATPAKPSTVNQRDLAQLIATSSVQHIGDAWSYLGRSLISGTRGDVSRGLHLGYYASLRGAMGLLASEGIGVLNQAHFRMDTGSTVSQMRFTNGTHVAAWLALDHWAGRVRSGDMIASVIRPGGRPLRDWFVEAFGGSRWRPVARDWMRLWGADLWRFSGDRDLRNAVSYRPDGARSPGPPPAHDAARFLTNIWALIEPAGSPFGRLDRHLLRMSLEATYAQTSGRAALDPGYETLIGRVLAGIDPAREVPTWEDFLMRRSDASDPIVVQLARSPAGLNQVGMQLRVAARAFLLLRVATGIVESAVAESSLTDLDFWRMPLLEHRAILEVGATRPDPADLWADVEPALEEFSAWLDATAAPSSYRAVAERLSAATAELSGLERVIAWSFP